MKKENKTIEDRFRKFYREDGFSTSAEEVLAFIFQERKQWEKEIFEDLAETAKVHSDEKCFLRDIINEQLSRLKNEEKTE